MIKDLWLYLKSKKYIYVVIAIALFIDYGIAVMPTQIVKTVVDSMQSQLLTESKLNSELIFLLVITVIGYIAIYFWIKLLFNQGTLYRYELRMKLFNKLLSMKIPYYDKFKSGDMMTRFTSDIDAISELLGYGFMSILISVASLSFILPTMFAMSWQITIFACLPLVLVGYIVYLIGRKQDTAVEVSREAVANLSNEVLEIVEGVRVMRAYGKRELGKKHFQKKTKDLRLKTSDIIKYSASFGRIAVVGVSISTMVVIGLGGYYISLNQMTLGEVIAMQLYTLLLQEPMWMLSDLILVYQSAHTSFNKVNELLQETDEMNETGDLTVQAFENLSLNQYTFTYANSEIGLSNISVTLQKGQTLGVVGKTGSGKTTFVRQFLMQYPLGSGQFTLNGQAISNYKREAIEKLIAYVPQEHTLFSKSVKENLLIGNSEASIIDIAVAVKSASFTDDLERMSDGIETLIGEKGVSISGGQKQRIAIARAFLKNADILILDDSLSAVDAKTEREIIENIQQVRKGKTNIIVTHRLSAVNHADYVIVLDNGEIVEEGTPSELLACKGWYFEQYEKQQLEGGESHEVNY